MKQGVPACVLVLFVSLVVAFPPAPIKPAQAWPNYDQLTSLADAFQAAIHAAHDSNETHPLNPNCTNFIPLFSRDAKIVNSNNTFTPEAFCLLWTAIPVHNHVTEFKSTMIEDVPTRGYQTIGFYIVDVGTLVYKTVPSRCRMWRG